MYPLYRPKEEIAIVVVVQKPWLALVPEVEVMRSIQVRVLSVHRIGDRGLPAGEEYGLGGVGNVVKTDAVVIGLIIGADAAATLLIDRKDLPRPFCDVMRVRVPAGIPAGGTLGSSQHFRVLESIAGDLYGEVG